MIILYGYSQCLLLRLDWGDSRKLKLPINAVRDCYFLYGILFIQPMKMFCKSNRSWILHLLSGMNNDILGDMNQKSFFFISWFLYIRFSN